LVGGPAPCPPPCGPPPPFEFWQRATPHHPLPVPPPPNPFFWAPRLAPGTFFAPRVFSVGSCFGENLPDAPPFSLHLRHLRPQFSPDRRSRRALGPPDRAPLSKAIPNPRQSKSKNLACCKSAQSLSVWAGFPKPPFFLGPHNVWAVFFSRPSPPPARCHHASKVGNSEKPGSEFKNNQNPPKSAQLWGPADRPPPPPRVPPISPQNRPKKAQKKIASFPPPVPVPRPGGPIIGQSSRNLVFQA